MNRKNKIESKSTAKNSVQIPGTLPPAQCHEPYTNGKPKIDRTHRGHWECKLTFPRNRYLADYGGVEYDMLEHIGNELWSGHPQYKQSWLEDLCSAAGMQIVGNVSRPA